MTLAEAGGDAGSAEGSVTLTCDASLLTGDAAGACGACKATHCAAEVSACAADCGCGPIEACLEVMDLNYTACPGAVAAISSGEAALTALADCTAAMCLAVCFPTDAGGG